MTVEYLQSQGPRNLYVLITEKQVINNAEVAPFFPVGTWHMGWPSLTAVVPDLGTSFVSDLGLISLTGAV